MEPIDFAPDRFGGVVTDADNLPSDLREFEERLRYSLDLWTSRGFKAVWMSIPNERVALVPAAVMAGFSYHHAAGSRLLLTRRLIDSAFIPPYATHYIGVGGVVVNDATRRAAGRIREIPPRLRPRLQAPGRRAAARRAHRARRPAGGLGGDRSQDSIRVAGLLPPLARLPLRQVGHLLRMPTLAPDPGDQHADGGDLRVPLDAH